MTVLSRVNTIYFDRNIKGKCSSLFLRETYVSQYVAICVYRLCSLMQRSAKLRLIQFNAIINCHQEQIGNNNMDKLAMHHELMNVGISFYTMVFYTDLLPLL